MTAFHHCRTWQRSTFALLVSTAASFPASLAGAEGAGIADLDDQAGVWRLLPGVASRIGLPSNGALAAPGGGSGPLANGSCEWLFEPNVGAHPAEPSIQHLWPDVAVAADDRVAVAWMGNTPPSNFHIYYTISSDGGQTWSMPERVDSGLDAGYHKFVDMDFTPSGVPVLVWEYDGTGTVYISRRDPGSGWMAPVPVTSAGAPPGPSYFRNPSLAVLDEDRYFVAYTDWREGTLHQVYARGTWDGGLTWGPERRVSDGLGLDPVAGDPCLIVDPSSGSTPGTEILCCVTNDWRGFAPGGRFPNVYFYRSVNGGGSWSIGVRVNDVEPGYQQTSSHALVIRADGALTAGWLNNPDITQSHFATSVSTDQGATWTPGAQVDPPGAGGTGTYSSIVAAGNQVFAGFDLYEGSWNAYFRSSADGGLTWIDPACRVDDAPEPVASENTVVAAASLGEVHGAWMDNRPDGFGNWQVYAARGTRDLISTPNPSGVGHAAAARSGIVISPNPSVVGRPVEIRARWAHSPGSGEQVFAGDVTVFDAAGRAVRRLVPENGIVAWDGHALSAGVVAPGVYFIRARASIRSPDAGSVSSPPVLHGRLVLLSRR